jgi:hypothetical protein
VATQAYIPPNNPPAGSLRINGTATEGQTLSFTSTLSDADGIPSSGTGAIKYQWLANGTAIAGANGAGYILTQAEVGKTITVVASYTDLRGSAESLPSAATTAVTPFKYIPVISGVPANAQVVQVAHSEALPDVMITNAGNLFLSVTLSPINGSLGGVSDTDAATPGIQFTGTAAAINTALAGATFTASAAGAASVGISVSDASNPNPATATLSLTAQTQAVLYPPVITGLPKTVMDVVPGVITPLPDFWVSDADSTQLSVTLTASNGSIGVLIDADPNTAGVQLTGTAAQINAVLANATFSTGAIGAAAMYISVSDGQANSTGVIEFNALQESASADIDNVPSQVEDLVPVLTATTGTQVAGDGNGDGIADSTQAAVTSTSFRQTSSVSLNPDAPLTYVTLVADSNAGSASSNTPAQLSLVEQKDAPANLPAEITMPLGLISFTATLNQSSTILAPATETFSLFVDAGVTINGYWKQDAQGLWNNLATKIETVGGKTRVDFAITDGSQFDADHTVNGVIVDPGALGNMPLSLVGHAPVLPADGYWF